MRITPSTEIRWRTVMILSVLSCTRARASASSMLGSSPSPPDHLNAEDNLSSLLSISCSAKIGCGDAGDRSITDVAAE